MRKLGVVCAVLGLLTVAGTTNANTVASSTMYFYGYLEYDCVSGAYTGTINMVDEATLGIGDGVAGFDVYAKNGATAWFGDGAPPGDEWTSESPIANHDAWPSWTVDTPDWYQYSLELTTTGWALRNHPGSEVGTPQSTAPAGVPMSGTMDWAAMIATETDVGAYLPGTGTAEIPGGAASKGGGAGAWDMDWSWGSEMVPLEYGAFAVEVHSEPGSGLHEVWLIPVPEPVTMLGMFLGLGSVGAYIRRRRLV